MSDLENNEIISFDQTNSQLDTTDDILAAANRRIAQLDQIVTLSLKRTNVNDWVDQQGKPYLVCSGAEKIARLFGVCWTNIKSEKIISSDETGQFYFYEFSGEFRLGRDMIYAVGTCSQKDAFFSKTKEGTKPLSEIDETNIRKAAYSNMVVNGVSRILGIRNLTWEQLAAAGIDRNKTSKITYKDSRDHSNDMPEDPSQWLEWLKTQQNPKNYYGAIKNSAAPDDVKRACVNFMYPKSNNAAQK